MYKTGGHSKSLKSCLLSGSCEHRTKIMSTGTLLLLLIAGLLPLACVGFFVGRRKALGCASRGERLHSLPEQYGWYAVVRLLLPSLGLPLLFWGLNLFGLVVVPPSIVLASALAVGAAGLWLGLRRINPSLRARNRVEQIIRYSLLLASLISILTTIGIVFSVLFEALRFFHMVGFWDFITGTTWSPGTAFLEGAGRSASGAAKAQFGAVPIFAGTFLITTIAMLVAVPVGLFSAIYMAEYATPRVRNIAKPMLEILAGIPTVVYGFFAAITVSPLVVNIAESLGLNADSTNALSPGIVMGIMIIPFISSLSDDVISSVPSALPQGSLALGLTRSETIKGVLLPAALPGIVSAFLLAVSRALGETMIVVMAAGLRPNLTANPLEGITTVTVMIVANLTGDQSFDSPLTLSAFGLGLVLLIVTLMLNLVSLYVIRRFRQQYE